jgi:magnesium transporter
MAPPEAEEVEELLRYPPETAGGRMAPTLVRVRDDVSVADLLEQFRSSDEMEEEDIYNIYVVDASDRLLGVVALWDLLRAAPATPLRDVMEKVEPIPADMDQEEVASIFEKYDIAAAPVVDRGGRLLGRITFDDVQDVVIEEMTEDMSKFAGTDDEELASLSSVTTARLRLPWLLICLAGTFVSGSVIHHYGGTLKTHLILMIFVPAVMATAGNSGLQTATMTIRGLATGYVERVGSVPLILKQLKATVLLAAACGVLAGVVAGVWSIFSPEQFQSGDAALLGGIIGGSMFAAICLSATLGVLVPMTFGKIGIDPAVASGPLITTSSDIFSLVVYLGMATALLVKFAS